MPNWKTGKTKLDQTMKITTSNTMTPFTKNMRITSATCPDQCRFRTARFWGNTAFGKPSDRRNPIARVLDAGLVEVIGQRHHLKVTNIRKAVAFFIVSND